LFSHQLHRKVGYRGGQREDWASLGSLGGREASRKKWVKNKQLAQNRFLIFITAQSSNKKSILNPEYSARRIVWRTLINVSLDMCVKLPIFLNDDVEVSREMFISLAKIIFLWWISNANSGWTFWFMLKASHSMLVNNVLKR
jgi:hypothetical protein